MSDNRKAKKTTEMVDVTSDETRFVVQCEDIRLISSDLKPLVVEEEADKITHFAFRIHAVVEGQKAYSYLEVLVNYLITDKTDELQGFQLSYVLMGTFFARQGMLSEDLGQFVKMYTLSILWPYAREYATDQLRRAGTIDAVLPIINPQVVTEHIVENNLVEVDFIKSEEKEEK